MRIGILGGGQLGRYLALASYPFGFTPSIFTPEKDSPALKVTKEYCVASWDDYQALELWAKNLDIVTFEFENIPVETVEFLETILPVFPSSKVLQTTQNRLQEKRFCHQLDIPTVPFKEILSRNDLQEGVLQFGHAILKTCRDGYDGKGQWVLNRDNYLDLTLPSVQLILEKKVSLYKEFSIIVARKKGGEKISFPPSENVHKDGILFTAEIPARIDRKILLKAQEYAEKLADNLDVIGLLTTEFFLTHEREILVNEMAPRSHNSGHWTLDACNISQFSQWIRSITDFPLVKPNIISPALMVNLLGDEINSKSFERMKPSVRWHDYGKLESRPLRKMGHYTIMRLEERDQLNSSSC